MTTRTGTAYDVAIIGGGPSGAVAGLLLARAGMSVVVLEKNRFPRFHIGESFLPHTVALLEELGLLDKIHRIPHVVKYGAEFAMGSTTNTTSYPFRIALAGGRDDTFNMARAPFDRALLDAAQGAGVRVHQQAAVKRIVCLEQGRVHLHTDCPQQPDVHARHLIDASGQGTVVGRHLGIRRPVRDRRLGKVAYFAHYQGVYRRDDEHYGSPCIVMCDEGWFWIIHLDEHTTSVGLVVDPAVVKHAGVPANRMLAWGIARCPLMRQRMKRATGSTTNHVLADFTYRCQPYAGPGYFLVGDAATFHDPVFSTGVHLGLWTAKHAAELLIAMRRGAITPAGARRRYARVVRRSLGLILPLIRRYYDHAFRELFLHGSSPLKLHQAVIAYLTGNLMTHVPWSVRWRFRVFELCVLAQRWVPLVPHRARFSLLEQPDLPDVALDTAAVHRDSGATRDHGIPTTPVITANRVDVSAASSPAHSGKGTAL